MAYTTFYGVMWEFQITCMASLATTYYMDVMKTIFCTEGGTTTSSSGVVEMTRYMGETGTIT